MTNSTKKNNLWILFSIILFLNGMGFVYIGSKSSNRKWIVEGIIYEIPWIIVFILAGLEAPATIGIAVLVICFIGMLVSLIRSFLVKKDYDQELESDNYKRTENKGSTFVKALLCLIPFINGLLFIYLGFKNKNGKFIIGGVACEIIWLLIGTIHGLVGIAMSSLLVTFILFIQFHYETINKTPVVKTTPQKETKPKTEPVVTTVENNNYKEYELQLNNLKQTYDKKESKIKASIDEKFKTSQITHSHFISIIDNSHDNFYNQYEIAFKLIDLSSDRDVKIEEKLNKKVDIMKKINDKMEELEIELIMNKNDEKKSDDDFNELMNNLGELIDSVKDYE